MITHVVWDWNGTLLDDLSCCVGVTNQMLVEFGLPLLRDVDHYQSVFRFPIADYYADLGFAPAEFSAAAHRYIELYTAAAAACELHPGAEQALSSLHGAGLHQVLISASQQQVLTNQVTPFGLDRWLSQALGIEDIYAASKLGLAQRWLAEQKIAAESVLFIGDSEHDFEIADSLGASCILFSGGHHGHERLSRLGAPVINDLSQLPDVAADLV